MPQFPPALATLQGAGGLSNQVTDPRAKPNMQTILDGLRRSGQPNPSLSPNTYEAKPDLGLPIVADSRAGQEGLDYLHSKLGEGPMLGLQRSATADTEERQRQAWLGGDASPQEAARKAEELERFKIDAPSRAQEVAGKYNVQQQQVASKGNLDVANTNQSGLAARYDALTGLLAGGLAPGAHLGLPGGGSVTAPAARQVPAGLAADVTRARQKLATDGATTGWSMMGGGGDSVAKQTFDQAVQMYLQAHPADPAIKDWALKASKDTRTKDLPFEQVLQLTGEDSMTPEERAQAEELLSVIRGH